MQYLTNKPSPAFIAISWVALALGMVLYFIGLWNAQMALSEKGFYFILMLFGLFSALSLQKVVRDKLENIPVTNLYVGLCWASVIICIVLLCLGLWNAELLLSEKGFYGMAFVLSLFGMVAVQKNVRDLDMFRQQHREQLKNINPSYTEIEHEHSNQDTTTQ